MDVSKIAKKFKTVRENIIKSQGKIALFFGVLFIVTITTLFSYYRVFKNYESETLDIRFKLRPVIPVDKDIVIIEVSDDTVKKIGTWPISRKYHAMIVDALTEAGVEAIFFDVFFSQESNEEADLQFEEAIRKSGKVYLPYVFNISKKKPDGIPSADRFQEVIFERFKKDAKGTGFINIIPDTDGKFRRVPPLIRYENALYPHICLSLYADYFGLENEEIKVKEGRYVSIGSRVKMPLDSNSTIIVNFPGPWDKTFRHYSYIDILDSYVCAKFPDVMQREPIIDLTELEGSVCFIGVTATATPDAHPSPFDTLYPGVGVHASLFNSMLYEKFIYRVSRVTSIVILIILCAITYFISKHTKKSLGFLYIFLFLLLYLIVAYALFIGWGIWINVFYPVIVVVLFYLGATFVKYLNETYKREVLEKELGIAKKIQESFLPKEKPKVSGIDIAVKMVTARQVGGDLYGYVEMSESKVGIMLGDVSGKGVPAALYMAKVVSEFKTYSQEELASNLITKLNERLCMETGSGLFVTLSYAIFDMKERSISYSTGGHLPMIMLRRGESKARLIDLKEGMPLGLFEGVYCEEKIQFESGDTFMLYSDGVTEAMDPKGNMFGEERLVDLIEKNSELSAEALTNLTQDAVKKFEKGKQHDDITVLTIRIE